MNKKIILTISSILVLVIIVLLIYLSSTPQKNEHSTKRITDINLLNGEWLRTDADYLIKIINVNQDGTIEARYFNPKSINIESATWKENYSNLKIFIILRDVNYPGSTYRLNYLPDRDILAGEYYQAVEGVTFYVEFARSK